MNPVHRSRVEIGHLRPTAAMRYRVTRRKYLLVTFLWMVPALLIAGLGGGGFEAQVLAYLLFSPVWIWVGVGRLHDMGRGGWWLVFSFIPGINVLFNLFMLVGPPTPGANRFGPDPRDSAQANRRSVGRSKELEHSR